MQKFYLWLCDFFDEDDDDDDDDELFLWYGGPTKGLFSLISSRDHCQNMKSSYFR